MKVLFNFIIIWIWEKQNVTFAVLYLLIKAIFEKNMA